MANPFKEVLPFQSTIKASNTSLRGRTSQKLFLFSGIGSGSTIHSFYIIPRTFTALICKSQKQSKCSHWVWQSIKDPRLAILVDHEEDLEGFGGEYLLESASMMMEDADSSGAAPSPSESPSTPQPIVRSEFADLLKWVGAIETDANGEASIPFETPDNLTTWKIKTWAMGKGSQVGEGSAEIITSKDLLIRLQAPRFFVEKDKATVSAIVHNYHPTAKDVAISLGINSPEKLQTDAPLAQRVAIAAQGETRIDWPVMALQEGDVKVRMKAIAENDSDAIEMTFPILVHGMQKTESFSHALSPNDEVGTIKFEIPEDRRPAETRLTLNYSPSIAVSIVDALPYLADYPYGCTEQTLNRFVPTTVVHNLLKNLGYDLAAIGQKRSQLNPQQLGDGERSKARFLSEESSLGLG